MKLNPLYLLVRYVSKRLSWPWWRSGLETDAGAVNRAILSGIRRLNKSIASLGGYHGSHADFEDDLESEDVSYVSINNNIANSGPAAVTERESDTDVLLDYCCQLDVETNAKAPKINEKVAHVVNKLCVKRVSQDQSKEIMKRHKIQRMWWCVYLSVSRVSGISCLRERGWMP